MFSSSRSIHSGARLVRGVRAPLIVSCSSLSEVTPAPIVMTDRTNVRVFLGGGGIDQEICPGPWVRSTRLPARRLITELCARARG